MASARELPVDGSDEDCNPKIHEAMVPLKQLGITLPNLDQKALMDEFMSTNQFIKHLKVLIPFHNRDAAFKQMMLLAVRSRGIKFEVVRDLPELLALCDWLRTQSGRKAITATFRYLKLQKRVAPWQHPVDAFRKVLTGQLADFAHVCEKIKVDFEDDIAELKRQMKEKKENKKRCKTEIGVLKCQTEEREKRYEIEVAELSKVYFPGTWHDIATTNFQSLK